MPTQCIHLDQIQVVQAHSDGCEDCLKMGDKWLHLRLCLECGHVGCCDSSKNKHATKHFHTSNHPIIKSFEPGEEWGWCYEDQLFIDPDADSTFKAEVAKLPRHNYRQHRQCILHFLGIQQIMDFIAVLPHLQVYLYSTTYGMVRSGDRECQGKPAW